MSNNIKKSWKNLIKIVLGIKNTETFSDGIERHIQNFKNAFISKKVSANIIKEELIKSGINPGDTLIVHASWRAMKAYKGTPETFIDSLLEILGKDGNLIMPAFGNNKTYFDINNTKSSAGILSEVFRTKYQTQRSLFPDSSMICLGKNSNEIINSHMYSKYAFDEFSPYSIAINKFNGKILLVGMGKSPHKISVFHCSSYRLRKNSHIYSKIVKSSLINIEGKKTEFQFYDRVNGCSNNKKKFKILFQKVPKYFYDKMAVNFTLFNGREALEICDEFLLEGGEIYNFKNR